jgi:hypothetical protein
VSFSTHLIVFAAVLAVGAGVTSLLIKRFLGGAR